MLKLSKILKSDKKKSLNMIIKVRHVLDET